MVMLECPMGASGTCDYKTQELDMDNAMVMLQMYGKKAHQQGLGEVCRRRRLGRSSDSS